MTITTQRQVVDFFRVLTNPIFEVAAGLIEEFPYPLLTVAFEAALRLATLFVLPLDIASIRFGDENFVVLGESY